MLNPLQEVYQARREQVRVLIQRDDFPGMGNAQFLHEREKALKEFRHSSTLSGGIDVKHLQSGQSLSSTINVCQHFFSNQVCIAI